MELYYIKEIIVFTWTCFSQKILKFIKRGKLGTKIREKSNVRDSVNISTTFFVIKLSTNSKLFSKA